MSRKFPTFSGFIQPPSGWSVEQQDGYTTMLNATRDAELRVTTFDVDEVRFDATSWLASVVRANRRLSRALVASEYGPFAGYAIEVGALGTRIRGWFLRAGSVPLVITYRAPESVGSRDDAIVQRALETLSLAGGSFALTGDVAPIALWGGLLLSNVGPLIFSYAFWMREQGNW